jgi:hypothetical protein
MFVLPWRLPLALVCGKFGAGRNRESAAVGAGFDDPKDAGRL